MTVDINTDVFKMAAKFKNKRTLISTMRAQYRVFAIFAPPLVSHWSLLKKRINQNKTNGYLYLAKLFPPSLSLQTTPAAPNN
jgi:hypothetical protein